NTLVAGAGCHAGYNIVDEDAIPGVTVPLDWVEAFAQHGATLVAGPGTRPAAPTSSNTGDGRMPASCQNRRVAAGAVPSATTPASKALKNLDGGSTVASWFTGPDGVLTNPGEPALPLARYDVSVPGRVARGVGFRGGTFATPEPTGLTPLTGAATTEQQAV